MEHKVTGCYGCPLAFLNMNLDWVCGHPSAYKLKCPVTERQILDKSIPDGCPLKAEPITISLTQVNNS